MPKKKRNEKPLVAVVFSTCVVPIFETYTTAISFDPLEKKQDLMFAAAVKTLQSFFFINQFSATVVGDLIGR